jgi:hypothetical protein
VHFTPLLSKKKRKVKRDNTDPISGEEDWRVMVRVSAVRRVTV